MGGVTTRTPSSVQRAAWLIGVVVLVSLLAGHVLGIPVLLSYVETGSMEPTIGAGDGFVAVPASVSGTVEVGDVVVFEAREIEGGGLTTHRVVGVTDDGYVTRGDANPFTDQAGDEPHVTDGQIVATALQLDGEVVTIPGLGRVAMATEAGIDRLDREVAGLAGGRSVLGVEPVARLLLVLGLLLVGLSVLGDRRGGRDRTRVRSEPTRSDVAPGTMVLALAALLCLVTAGTMVAMSGSTEFGIISSSVESDRPDVIAVGETEDRNVTLTNDGLVPVVVLVEPASDGIEVDGGEAQLERGESLHVTLSVSAPDQTGYYLRSFEEHRYVAVLPAAVVTDLHAVHPWVARGAVTAVVVTSIVLPFALAIDRVDSRTRTRRRRAGSTHVDRRRPGL